MATGKKINIVTLSGYSFEIDGHWDVSCMIDSICCHMDKKLMSKEIRPSVPIEFDTRNTKIDVPDPDKSEK